MIRLRLLTALAPVAVLLGALGLALPSLAQNGAIAEAELRARIESRLAQLGQEGADVRVTVSGGDVVLQGSVPLLEHSLRAEQTVWKTQGVTDVDNELRVRPPTAADDETIELGIRALLTGDAIVRAPIQLDVLAGTVRLRGTFRDPSDVLMLKHRIAAMPGVLEVEIDAILVALRGSRDAPAA